MKRGSCAEFGRSATVEHSTEALTNERSHDLLCRQAESGHGGIEGDLVQGTDVGDAGVFVSARADRPFNEEARPERSRRGGVRQPWEPLRIVQ